MVIAQGDIFWASLPDPVGSGPGLRRPVVVVQGDALNASELATVVVVPLNEQPAVVSCSGERLAYFPARPAFLRTPSPT